MDDRLLRTAKYLSSVFKINYQEVIGWLWIRLPDFEKGYKPEKGIELKSYINMLARSRFVREFLKLESQADHDNYWNLCHKKSPIDHSRLIKDSYTEDGDTFEDLLVGATEQQKIVLRMMFVEDLRGVEIARRLKTSGATVSRTIKAGLNNLRKS